MHRPWLTPDGKLPPDFDPFLFAAVLLHERFEARSPTESRGISALMGIMAKRLREEREAEKRIEAEGVVRKYLAG